MKRVLFIGNSHLAAIKTAWEQAAPQGYDAEFFGAPQRAWQRMALLPDNMFGLSDQGDYKRQREITEQANGKAQVSLQNRDAIVIVGGFSAAEPLAQLLADCDVTTLRETGAPTLLSEPLFAKSLATLAAQQLPPGWTQPQTALLPRPAQAETCLTSTNSGYAHWHRLAANPMGLTDAADLFDAALTATFAAQTLTYIPQPTETRSATLLTLAQYLAPGGGTQKGDEQKRGDHAHMNTAYGSACLASLLPWLNH